MTKRCDLSAFKDKFLDNFPLTVTEVEWVIVLFELSDQQANQLEEEVDLLSLSALSRQFQSQIQQCKNGTRTTCQEDEEEEEEEHWLLTLQQVQEEILPEASRWLLIEAPTLVCPLLPCDIPDDKTLVLCRAFYCFEAVVSLLGRRSSRFLTGFLYDMASKKNKTSSAGEEPTAEILVDVLYRHLMAALCLQQELGNQKKYNNRNSRFANDKANNKHSKNPPNAWIRSLARATNTSSATKGVTRQGWITWIDKTLPEAMRGISTFYHHALFPPGHSTTGPNSLPQLALPKPDQDSFFWNYQDSSSLLPLTLGCMSSSLCGNWYRLYASNWDGLSFLTFQKALLSYAGPTAILIRPKGTAAGGGLCNNNDGMFGFYSECPWKESNSWFGGGDGFDSFFFKFNDEKDFGVYWPTWESPNNGHCMYLNTSPEHGMHNHHHNATPLRGLAIGGISNDTPRVHLTPSLENCKATTTDTAYESGPLLAEDDSGGMMSSTSPVFHVDALELWAVNVSQEEFLQRLAVGRKQLARKEEVRQRAAQVDRSLFLDDFKTGAFINHLFAHREEARGRHDFVAADNRSGYFVEGKRPSQSVLSPSGSEPDGGEEAAVGSL
jgi:TLD